MNSFARHLSMMMLGTLSGLGAAHAQDLPGSNAASSNPYNSPIHRANPNSRQGTQPSTPPAPGTMPTPTPRQPTLENGGIGNGYPVRQTPQTPSSQVTDPKRP
ncbi:hypothetical protein [Pseudomonas sp. NPDC089734]|uniref:hypothetical protein n=1 Tax=Pseudomonas sp. NPDC089734 TaxID=3364469 RepID=UPI003829F0E6